MPSYPAEQPTSVGTILTQRTATAAADNVSPGCILVLHNTGASTRTVRVFPGRQVDGLFVSGRSVLVAPGAIVAARIPANYGDDLERVWLTVDGTASEVTYWVIRP